MELSPRQRRAVFAVIVIALAALGYYLVVPAVTHSRGHTQAAASPTLAGPAAATTPAPGPTETAPAAAAGAVNIYAWLPFTQQDLATAASVAVRFGIDYNTYAYTESAAAYVAKMTGLITGQLATTLQAGYSTPGVAQYADQPAAGLHWDRGDQFATGLRPIQPDVRGQYHAAPGQLPRCQQRQRSVRGHPDRLGQQLAGQRHRAGVRG